MATTVGQVLETLLLYFSPEERGIPSSADYPGRCEEAVRAVNAAVQDMAAIASSVFSGEEKGFTTRSSVTVTLSATNGSTTATITGLGTVEPALCLLDASGVQEHQITTAWDQQGSNPAADFLDAAEIVDLTAMAQLVTLLETAGFTFRVIGAAVIIPHVWEGVAG